MYARCGAAEPSGINRWGTEAEKALTKKPGWCTVNDTKAEQTLVQPGGAWGDLES
jgi:hypothetical protein